jgi:uncharacterized protein YbdZ (MbtH family)
MVWNLFYSCRIGGLEAMSIDPFDEDNGSFFVFLNHEEQHSLWPAFADLPADRRLVYREADCA